MQLALTVHRRKCQIIQAQILCLTQGTIDYRLVQHQPRILNDGSNALADPPQILQSGLDRPGIFLLLGGSRPHTYNCRCRPVQRSKLGVGQRNDILVILLRHVFHRGTFFYQVRCLSLSVGRIFVQFHTDIQISAVSVYLRFHVVDSSCRIANNIDMRGSKINTVGSQLIQRIKILFQQIRSTRLTIQRLDILQALSQHIRRVQQKILRIC